jgi:hypothetical protein
MADGCITPQAVIAAAWLLSMGRGNAVSAAVSPLDVAVQAPVAVERPSSQLV